MAQAGRTNSRYAPTAAVLPALLIFLLLAGPTDRPGTAQGRTPTATLAGTSTLRLTGAVDSNSPAVWERVDDRRRLYVLTSVNGVPSLSSGSRLGRLDTPLEVSFVSHPGEGVWMEAVVADEDGTWYGYYHNEIPADLCGRPDLVKPRIGAARSMDRGESWEDLGIILEAPPGMEDCDTPNRFVGGGVGDESVVLDREATFLYLFFSQYSRPSAAQGVGVARLQWADRDAPVGRVDIWVNGAWLPGDAVPEWTEEDTRLTWVYPAGTPLVRPIHPWHDADPVNDAFWGAAVHWNSYLEQYVMLLNRTKNESFTQEGIYVSFAPALDDPTLWSKPQRILAGGAWYPQVIGTETGEGTDKLAGASARFFMRGTSTHIIEFGYK